MKPFDIDLARQGHPVCYRDGTVPDLIHILPEWVAATTTHCLIATMAGGGVHWHTANGSYSTRMGGVTNNLDLFMKIEPIITRYGADQHYHRISGRFREDIATDRDLFMNTENKTGWINICETKPTPIIYETEEEARAVCATFPTGSRAFTIKIEWEDWP